MAADAPSFADWTSDNIKDVQKELATKLVDGSASKVVANMGNYSFMMVLRKQTGLVEVHETQTDIMFVKSGEAILATGGKVVNGKTTGLHEIRGSAMDGGSEHPIKAGDVITIPAGMSHLVKVAPGKEVFYVTVKVTVP